MAHFAELDWQGNVKRVVVVDNNIPTANGPLGENDRHIDGEVWCQQFFKGGIWKQCSYNNTFRANFPSEGYKYDKTNDVFYEEQPFESWSLDSNWRWQPPIEQPDLTYEVDGQTRYYTPLWHEASQKWYCQKDPEQNFELYLYNENDGSLTLQTQTWEEINA